MTAKQIIATLDATGGIVYPDGATAGVFAYAGIRDARVWYLLGDTPHWGPRESDLQGFGEYAVGRKTATGLAFYMTGPGEAPEIPHWKALKAIEETRDEITRETAIQLLGDPPADDSELIQPAYQTQGGKPAVPPAPGETAPE